MNLPIGDGVFVLLRSTAGFRAFQVWVRLVETSLPEFPLVRGVVGAGVAALAALPPSQRAEVSTLALTDEVIDQLFGSDSVVVGIQRSGEVVFKLSGGPTDAGWDQLELAARGSEGTPAS